MKEETRPGYPSNLYWQQPNPKRMLRSSLKSPAYSRTCGLFFLLMSLGALGFCNAQQPGTLTADNAIATRGDLPDAPSPMSDETSDTSSASLAKSSYNATLGVTPRAETGTPARKFDRIVQPGEFGQPLDSADKLKLAIMSRLTMSDVVSTALSAGWSQMLNTSPNFGTDRGAFGERLGALALKQTTQSIFNYGIYASLFHDDPRYYVMGPQKSGGARALYSASRLVITQTDDGRAAINWPKFAGIVSAIALTNAYYPAQDHGFAHGATAFGVSLGSTILNNEFHEFIGDGLRLLRHEHD